jgi:hypothetical protein
MMSNNGILPIVSLIIAGIAVCVSILSYFINKRKLYADIFPKSRIEWIHDVRVMCANFIDVYYSEYTKLPHDRHELIKAKFDIELFLNYTYTNPGYEELGHALSVYLHQPANTPIIDHDPLLYSIQSVLDSAFRRAKGEAGITIRKDDRIRRIYANKN